MNIPVLNLSLLLIPAIVILRFLLIIWERKNQLYTITTRGVASEGGVLNKPDVYGKKFHSIRTGR